MLMFVDMGEGGVDKKITDYVDMWMSLQNLICFALKGHFSKKQY